MHFLLSLYFGVMAIFGCNALSSGVLKTIQTGPKPLWNETDMDKLKKDLFMNYDKYARPDHHTNATEVQLEFSMTHVETDEIKSTFIVHGIFRLFWKDPKLTWDKDAYGGIAITRVADHEIWLPDIFVYNSATGGDPIFRYGSPNIILYPSGLVLWAPPTKITALCELDLHHWPFDTQHCPLKFGSWTHSGLEIKLMYNNNSKTFVEDTIAFSAWTVTNTSAEVIAKYYDCCPEPYYHVQYNVTLARKADSYKAVIVAPAVVNALLILMQFWLPPQALEKLGLNGFVAAVIIMFLVYFTNHIARAGGNTPLIVLFYSCSLYMICFAILANVAAFWLSKSKQVQALIRKLKKHIRGRFGKWLFLELKFREARKLFNGKSCQAVVNKKSSRAGNVSWSECAQDWILPVIVSRVLFVIYGLLFLVFGFVYLL